MTTFTLNHEKFDLYNFLKKEGYHKDLNFIHQSSLKNIFSFINETILKDNLIVNEILLDGISYFHCQKELEIKLLKDFKEIHFFFFNAKNYFQEIIWSLYLQFSRALHLLEIDSYKKNLYTLKNIFYQMKERFQSLESLENLDEKFKSSFIFSLQQINLFLLKEKSIIQINTIKDIIYNIQMEMKKNFDRCLLRQIHLELKQKEIFLTSNLKKEIVSLFQILYQKVYFCLQKIKAIQYNLAYFLLQDIMEGLEFSSLFLQKFFQQKMKINFFDAEEKIIPFIQNNYEQLEKSILKKDYFSMEEILQNKILPIYSFLEKEVKKKFLN